MRSPSCLKLAAAVLSCVGCLVAAASCGGGLEPGDYTVYRISYSAAEPGKACYPGNKVPPDIEDDSSSYRAGGVFILYVGPEEKLFLDVGSVVLEGSGEDDTFSFSGKSVDVKYTNPDCDGDRITTTRTTSIDFTLDGAAISGNYEDKITIKCKGECNGFDDTECEVSSEFVGTEIEEVEIKLDADGAGKGSPGTPGETECVLANPGPGGGGGGGGGA